MLENELKEVLSTKHLRLLKVAKASGIASWLALIFGFIAGWLRVFSIGNLINEYCGFSSFEESKQLHDLLFQPLFTPTYVADIILTILKWFVWFIVLRSIALALRMLVETDVNYRLQTEEVGNNGEL